MRKGFLALGVAALAAAVVGPALPAAGVSSVTGPAAVACKTNLPAWPTSSGSSTCSGKAVGAGSGVTTVGSPYVIGGLGTFSSSFTYSEPCTIAKQPPVLGNAKGTTKVTGLTAVVKTKKTTAYETGSFSWTRVGLVAVITTSGTHVYFGNSQTAAGAAPDAGVGTFAPLNDNPQTNVCPTGTSLTAEVVSSDTEPA